MDKTICELFAGVGGFRLGMERLNSGWTTTWFSQWEPEEKKQNAYECYKDHFGDCPDTNGEVHTNQDICSVDKDKIPNHSLLVGGFPCQDYSVAKSSDSALGIEGKKGVLWWQIFDVLVAKKPPFCIFENVDRLLKSPSKQRGRDFGIILTSLNMLGYSVEWRIVNAGLYGAGQRRKRVFIFAYSANTQFGKSIQQMDAHEIIMQKGLMAQAFPISAIGPIKEGTLPEELGEESNNFIYNFYEAGCCQNGSIYTATVTEVKEQPIPLRGLLQKQVADKYFITDSEKLKRWTYLKGPKRIPRRTADGFEYFYTEGQMPFPDSLDLPARTMLTTEGMMNRCSHVVLDPERQLLRTITPIEAERIQGFPDGWTDTGMTERKRYACMGNALPVFMVTRMGRVLDNIIKNEN